MRSATVAALLVLALAAAATSAQARGGAPVVRRVDVWTRGDVLVADLHLDGVFTDDLAATLDAGLPVRIDVVARLDPVRGGRGARIRRRVTLSHDVWTATWRLVRGDTSMTFASFDALRRAARTLRGVPLARVARIDRAREYVVAVAVTVLPPGVESDDPLEAVDTPRDEEGASRWRERMLDVGAVLQRVFGHDRSDSFRSAWYRSAAFRPDTLRDRGERAPHGRSERVTLARRTRARPRRLELAVAWMPPEVR